MVVILGLAADVDQPVDRGRAADHPAARVDDSATVGAGVRLGAELPGQRIVVEHLEEPGRNVDQRVPVAPACLDQQDFGDGVVGQPVGQHAAGRAGADNDVICLHASHSPRPMVRPCAGMLIRAHSLAHPRPSERAWGRVAAFASGAQTRALLTRTYHERIIRPPLEPNAVGDRQSSAFAVLLPPAPQTWNREISQT